METRFQHSKQEEQQNSARTPPENGVESPLSGDEAAAELYCTPSPRKSRRGANKRVVSVPVAAADGGSRSKTEVYPPPDSWSWRKYGQKPIKGSPYPRGYYRCSSSKGCPARKQVERSRLDPTTLLITYSSDHNHPHPHPKNHHHHHAPPSTTTATATTSPHSDDPPIIFGDPDTDNDTFPGLDFGWFSGEVGSTCFVESPTVGSTSLSFHDADVALIGEEDQSLFGDLGELPECSVVFRRQCMVETPCFAGTG